MLPKNCSDCGRLQHLAAHVVHLEELNAHEVDFDEPLHRPATAHGTRPTA
jgi:hypothetical protein